MKIKYFLFTFLSLCLSCAQQEESEYQLPKPQPKIVKANGYVVPKDSMVAPQEIKIDKSKLKVVKAGKPKVVATNTNIHKVGQPKIVKVGKPHIIKIGSDTFLLPKKVKATGIVVPCIMPKPVKAGLPIMKDDATCNMQYLDVNQGMNSSYVNCMLKDKRGNLWFGTDVGVSKYDGESFTHFTKKEGLKSNNIWSIIEDNVGNIWIGTSSGASKYNGESFTYYSEKEGLGNNTVWRIFEDKMGNLWFGTEKGVSKYDGAYFTHYTIKEGLINNIVWSITEDKTGNLWFGTNGGLSKYDGASFTNFTEKEGLSSIVINSILEDKTGNLWFGTDGGGISKLALSEVEGATQYNFTHFTEKEGLSNNTVLSIFEDKMGDLWFGTDRGVSKYISSPSGRSGDAFFTHFTEKEGLSDNTISSIVDDKTGSLWFGTHGGGVCKYNEASFTHFTEKEGLINNTVFSIIEDKTGNIWLGSYGGVSKYDGASFTHYTEKEGLSNNFIWCILEDKAGNLWFGTSGGGVCKYDGVTFTHFTEKDGLSNNKVWSITEDRTGNLWFGSWGGATKYKPSLIEGQVGSFTNFTEKEGLTSNVVYSIIEDRKGNIWFGMLGGVTKYEPSLKEGQLGSLTHFMEEEGLSNYNVRTMFEDKIGNLWFGTFGEGVCKYDGKYFTHFTEKEGLSNNVVLSIIEDPFKPMAETNLYFGTDKGLNNFEARKSEQIDSKLAKKNTQNNTLKWVNYKNRDGLKAEDLNTNAALIDSKGYAWWGTGKALTKLKVKDHKQSQTKPLMQMGDIELNEHFINYRSLTDGIKDSLNIAGLDKMKFKSVAAFNNYPIGLELPHNLNHLAFSFSAIDWAAPEKLQYQYKLDGLDKNWSALSHEHKADYRNIPFGKFTFKVRAIGVAGKWSNTFEYSFIIHPPFWRTWWAYSLYFITVITCLSQYIKWRVRASKQRQRILEATVFERTAALIEEKKIVVHQKEIVEEKQKEILDSIEYAKRIQATILPSVRVVKKYLEDSFILYLPKDIVAGDFYWMESIQLADEPISGLASEKNIASNQLIYFAACDCTGHGVPGAMVSVVCHNALNKALKEFGKRTPSEILDKVAELVIEDFNKNVEENDEVKDGMDASVCALDTDTGILQWAGANNPLWLIRKACHADFDKYRNDLTSSKIENEAKQSVNLGEITAQGRNDVNGGNDERVLIETKADKQPIGRSDERHPYTNHTFQLQKGDVIYLITDGYADQFGGEKNRKFQKAKLKELLFSIHQLSMDEQRNKLYEVFTAWRGTNDQVDDVCIIGVRI